MYACPDDATPTLTGPTSCSEEFVGGMPIYGGFELDVFQSLAQFFRSEPEPLISTALHDLFMAVLSELVETNKGL